MTMAILVGRDEADTDKYQWFIRDWQQALLALDPYLDIRVWPINDKSEIDFVLAWNPPLGMLKQFPHIKAIASLAAGVDHLFVDPLLSEDIPIVRVVDPYMANDIVQYVAAYILHYIKRIDHWALKQKKSQWSKEPPFTFSHKTIGIMGLGFLGAKAAYVLNQMGLQVIGWSNSPKNISGVKSLVGKSEFGLFLSQTDILICMLPLTNETRNILNQKTFAQLPSGAYIINVGRGDQVVEEDLLSALDKGHLEGACLDVFRQEPLPFNHLFWTHPRIRVTPHIASVTNPATAAPQVLENYRRALKGEPLLNVVDLLKGY